MSDKTCSFHSSPLKQRLNPNMQTLLWLTTELYLIVSVEFFCSCLYGCFVLFFFRTVEILKNVIVPFQNADLLLFSLSPLFLPSLSITFVTVTLIIEFSRQCGAVLRFSMRAGHILRKSTVREQRFYEWEWDQVNKASLRVWECEDSVRAHVTACLVVSVSKAA